MRITDHVHRIGSDSTVNAYLREEGGEVTIVDAALPGYYDDVPRELAAMGRTIEDVRAIVLTHGHSDHIGQPCERSARAPRSTPEPSHQVPICAKMDGPMSVGSAPLQTARRAC